MKISNLKLKLRQSLSPQTIVILLILFGAFLRFYNLNWGAPYYFHPDERNIASSVSQLQFPSNMNPHFFAYGSLPIYSIFFTGLPLAFFTSCHETLSACRIRFEDALIIGRAFSALFSVLLIPLLFLIGKKLHSEKTGLLAAVLVTLSTGLIQYAHFATFELWTTFLATLLLLLSLRVLALPDKINILAASLIIGMLIAVKATNALLLPVPFIALGIGLFGAHKHRLQKLKLTLRFLASTLLIFLTIALVFLLTNPFTFLAHNDFRGSMQYESGVALGTLPVFYTGEFYQTLPVIFQLIKVFPFLLNPVLTLLGVLSFFYVLLLFLRKKPPQLLLLILIFSLLLFPQAFFFVKWARYMVPVIPFSILLTSFFLIILSEIRKYQVIGKSLIVGTIVTAIIFGFSYFVTAFVEKDTRIAAAETASKTLPTSAPILSEMYDMGIVAFNQYFPRITLFNFYDLDTNSEEFNSRTLSEQLPGYEYLILPSQRVLATRRGHIEQFPQGYAFYSDLLKNKEKFKLVYETPCSIFCQITYLGDQTARFEGTVNTFDRPPLRIYKINVYEQ